MEAQELRLAKYFTAGISFLLIALWGSLWPFTWWDMYSSSPGKPPTEVSRIELHVVDSSGERHVLRPMDLYTLDDDTSNQFPGHRLVHNALVDDPEKQASYRPYLIKQIEFVLDTKIEQVEAWHYSWQVDFDQQPPIDINQPAQTVLIERFMAHSAD